MHQYFNLTGKWDDLKEQFDSFANHFGSQCFGQTSIQLNGRANTNDFRKVTTMYILWKSNLISCVQGFGRLSYSLCMHEMLTILIHFKTNPDKFIKYCNDFYSTCRYTPRPHRLFKIIPCTNERLHKIGSDFIPNCASNLYFNCQTRNGTANKGVRCNSWYVEFEKDKFCLICSKLITQFSMLYVI